MYAIEFETDLDSEYIQIPNYERLKNRHVKVILLTEEAPDEANSRPLKVAEMKEIVDQARSSGVSDRSLTEMRQQLIAKHKK